MIYCAIDNGVSGSLGYVSSKTSRINFMSMPTYSVQDYTKKKKNITRIHLAHLNKFFDTLGGRIIKVLIERPMVNPRRFMATCSALRALEATLIAVESHDFAYQFIDSKQWQKVILPHGVEGSTELKKASMDIGIRLFPQFRSEIEKHGDADSLLMAEVARRERW